MGPLVPPLPENETRSSTDTTSSSSGGSSAQSLAPEAKQAIAGMQGAVEGQKAIAAQEGALKVQSAQEDAAAAAALNEQQQALLQEKQEALTGAFSSTGAAYLAAKARLQQARDKLNGMDAPALFANRDNAGKYRLGIGVALAGLGDAMRQSAMIRIGKDPGSHSTVRDIIETDLQRQREAIEKAKDSVVMAKAGVADVDEARKQLLAEIDLKGAILAEKAASQMKATMAARGVPQAQIDANKSVADMTALQAKYQYDSAGHLTTTMEKHFENSTKKGFEEINRAPTDKEDKKVSPHESQNAEFAGQMAHELDVIKANGIHPNKSDLEKAQDNETAMAATEKPGVVSGILARAGRAVGLVPRSLNEGIPKEQQLLQNGWHNAAELVYHRLTGAGMAESEARRLADNLQPTPADSRDLVNEKLARLENFKRVAETMSGPRAQDMMREALSGGGASGAATVAPPAPLSTAARQITPTQLEAVKAALRRLPKDSPERKARMERFGIREEELR